jgi:hypothetical protein
VSYVRGGWIGKHYVIEDGSSCWRPICGFVAITSESPQFQDGPDGYPCLDCLRGEHYETHHPVAPERRIRLRSPNDPGTLWIQRNDARLISPCHRVPVHVAPGPLKGAGTADWSMKIDRICSTCGRVLDPEDCIATETATEIRNRMEGTNTP